MADLDTYANEVKVWASKLKEKMRIQAMQQTKSNPRENRNRRDREKSISTAFTSKVRLRDGAPNEVKIEWKGAVHAVFVEYGVGKGYIRINGKVVRGSRLDKKKNFKLTSGPIKRKEKKIISNPIDDSISELADIAQKSAEKRIINAMKIKF